MNNPMCGGCGQQPVLVSYPYTRSALYQCDCCNQMHQPNTAKYPSSGSMQENAYMVVNNVPYLLDNFTTRYGTKLSVAENIYTRVSKRNDPSCINLSAVFDMTMDTITTNAVWNAFLEDFVSNEYETLNEVLPIQKSSVIFKIYFHLEDANKGIVYENSVEATAKDHLFHYTNINDYFVTSFSNIAVTNIPSLDYNGIYSLFIDRIEAYVDVIDTKQHVSGDLNPYYQWTRNNTHVTLQHDTIQSETADGRIMIAYLELNNMTPVQLNVTTRLKINFTAYMSNTIMTGNSFGIYKALFNTSGHIIEDLQNRVAALEALVVELTGRVDDTEREVTGLGNDITDLEETTDVLDARVSVLEDETLGAIKIQDAETSKIVTRAKTLAEVKTYLQANSSTNFNVIISESAGITTFGPGALSGCPNLVGINIPEGVTTIDSGALSSSHISTITLPSTCTSLSNVAFSSCPLLTTVNLNEGLVTIGNNAFSGCGALTEITIPSTVTSITSAFTGCSALTSIVVRKEEGSISGAPWGATNATVTWTPANA